MIENILSATLDLYLDAAFWLLIGLLAAGLIKAWVPATAMARWLGGRGPWPVVKGALIGAPLPLCSCGVLPAALALRRAGASRGATVSFLVATPETGVDSVAVSYALLGPFMAVVRPIAAVASAVCAGLLAERVRERTSPPPPSRGAGIPLRVAAAPAASCGCSGGCAAPAPQAAARGSFAEGMRYAFGDLVDDLAPWLGGGLLAAGVVSALIPPQTFVAWGEGVPVMLLMLVVGIPMYICATASTPVAAALLAVGLSPGAVLVFLLAGPATNIATLALVRRELGGGVLAAYLFGVGATALGFGLLTDLLAAHFGAAALAGAGKSAAEVIPAWLEIGSGLVLALAGLRPLRRRIPGFAL